MRRPVRVVGFVAATLLALTACSSGASSSTGTSPSAGSKAGGASAPASPGPHTPCTSTPGPPPAPPTVLQSGIPPPPDRVYAVDNHLPPDAAPATAALVDVIDPATDEVTSSITVAEQPHHIYPVPHSNEAFVSHFVGCAMDVIDLTTNTVIGQVGTQFGPRHLAFDQSGRYAYAVNYYAASVSVVDTTSNRTVATIPTGEFPNYPQTSADGSLVFVVNSGSNTVTVAHAQAPFTVVATLTVGSHPFNLALTPDGRTMVVANAGDDTASLIDIPTLGVSAPISIHRGTAPEAVPNRQKLNVGISSDGRYAWIGDQLGSAFSVIDLQTRTLATVIPAASGADEFTELPTGPSAGQAITTARYGGFLDVVTPSPPALLSMVSTVPSVPITSTDSYPGITGPEGAGSHLVVVNPDGTRAYVSDRPGGAVTVLDLSGGHPTFLRNIPTSYGRYGYPDGLAYVTFTGGVATTTSTD
jgi:YVTN family beta-propeller protein